MSLLNPSSSFFFLPPLLSSSPSEFPYALAFLATNALSAKAPTHDNGKMTIIPLGEGPSNPSMAILESPTAVMAVDIHEVDPLAMIPLVGGQPGAAGVSGDLSRGRPTLSLPFNCSCSAPRSLSPHSGLTKPSTQEATPKRPTMGQLGL